MTAQTTETECCSELRPFLDARLFKALCDPTRLELLCRLVDHRGPTKVGELASTMPVDMSVVSRHLSILKDAGLVTPARKGKEVFYSISSSGAIETLRALADAIETCCPPRHDKQLELQGETS